MRRAIGLLIFTMSFTLNSASFANPPKQLQDFFTQSAKLRATAIKAPSNAKKLELLKSLKTSLAEARREYERTNPKEASAAEAKVTFFELTFTPLFALKALNAEECRRSAHAVKIDDLLGKPEGTVHSPEALEALHWLKILCP